MARTLTRAEQEKIMVKLAKRLTILEQRFEDEVEEAVQAEVGKQTHLIENYMEAIITKIEHILTKEQQDELCEHLDHLAEHPEELACQ